MNDFIFYFKSGLFHVLDIKAYDHILFLITLTVVYEFKHSKKWLWLITFFTIGHSITLTLSSYGLLSINLKIIEFLIPLTIFITAFINVLTAKKGAIGKENLNLFFSLFFGLIHGLGFSNYFKKIIDHNEDKIITLLEFAIGIEAAQIIITLAILFIGLILQSIFAVNRRDWIIVSSSIVIGFSLQMIINTIFW